VERHHAQLEARPATTNTRPNTSTWCLIWPELMALNTSLMSSEPVAPYIMDMPYSRKPLSHGTEHKVLHGRFGGDGVVAAQRHQRIARQREQFQAQVDHQEVVAEIIMKMPSSENSPA
jgi:hypothetical protein